MTPEQFRADRFLRSSGYDLWVWATVNAVVTLPAWSELAGRPWPPLAALALVVSLITAGIFVAGLNANRVEKMCGPATGAVVDAPRLWLPLVLGGFAVSFVLIARGAVAWIQPIWLVLVGLAYVRWGRASIVEYRWLGAALMLAGSAAGLFLYATAMPPGGPSQEALVIWLVFASLVWVPVGAWVNWKYVHARATSGQAAGAEPA
jgi:hypothetical protein